MSLNDIVGAAEEIERKTDAERLGGLEVDHEFDCCGLLDWKIGRLFALFGDATAALARSVMNLRRSTSSPVGTMRLKDAKA